MSDNIFGQRFTSRGLSAWHDLGRVFDIDDNVSVKEAITEVAGDIKIISAPVYYYADDYRDSGLGGRVENKVAIIRLPTPEDDQQRFFGLASDKWAIRQYSDYADALNSLSTDYPVETAGALGEGERVFYSLRGPSLGLEGPDGYGEEIFNYFIGELFQKPGSAHRVMHSPVRPVCSNTLTMAARAANINIRIPHTGNPAETMKFLANVVGMFDKHINETREIFQSFMGRVLLPDEFSEIVSKTFPMPKLPSKIQFIRSLSDEQRASMLTSPEQRIQLEAYTSAEDSYEAARQRADRLRNGVRELAEKFNADHPAVANTVWAAYNAVTELSDWREGAEKNIGESVLFGGRANEKMRAFSACLSLVN